MERRTEKSSGWLRGRGNSIKKAAGCEGVERDGGGVGQEEEPGNRTSRLK